MSVLQCFAIFLVLYSAGVSAYGSAKEGKCPPLASNVNCAENVFNDNVPCFQDIECTGTQKCCDDGCDAYECKPAIGLPVLPVVGPCTFDISSLKLDHVECKKENVTFCSNKGCKECCTHTSNCSPVPGHYIRKDECEKQLCKDKICSGQGEICIMDKYHRAKCVCPRECPQDFVGGSVCGTDKITYLNECDMNMTACVLGDLISVVHKGKCVTAPVNPCALVRCGFYTDCQVVDGSATCVCIKGCTRELNLKCGSDGITYSNPCELRRASCEQRKEITVANDGECAIPPKNPFAICYLPKDKGYGRELEFRYYFNQYKGICEGFLFHGEGGNNNNFKNAKDCRNHCFESVKDVCSLPRLVGPCRAAFPRWYFDATSQQCEQFIYGGCHANGNNFHKKAECEKKCDVKKVDEEVQGEICSLEKDSGFCLAFIPRWYYDNTSKECTRFIYGGCMGNANRFKTKEKCKNACNNDDKIVVPEVLPQIIPACESPNKFICRSIKKCIPVSQQCNGRDDCGDNSDETNCRVKDVCSLPRHVGPCRAAFPRWYFDATSQQCEQFIYGGCHANGNNFRKKAECEKKCDVKKVDEEVQGEICSLEKDSGFCLAFIPRWYYDSTSKECKRFIYGGCMGNANRFKTKEKCKNACNNDDKIVVVKNPCESVTCDFYSTCVSLNQTATICECPQICTADWRPVCGSDNNTYANLCGMRVESCNKQEVITKRNDGECGSRPKTKCEQERDAVNPILLGTFIAECEKDGSYKKAQCHGSTGYCWCVDELGIKLEETEIRFKEPNCEEVVVKNPCESVTCDFYSTCVSLNQTVTICECPKFCPEIWRPVCGSDNNTYPNHCGMRVESCEKQEVITKRSDGECDSTPKTKCEQERDAVNPFLIGAFTPQCEKDGSYKKAQCHGSTGYCWCVDELGIKIEETEIRFKEPNCEEVSRPKSKCEKEKDSLPEEPPPGAFIADCEKDGSYKKAQCHGSTGYCWCVDELGIKLEETEIRFKEPNCEEVFDICDISLCDFGKCVSVNGSATCECNEACPFIEQPVCGSDNKTYSNLCVMDAESCTKKQHINRQHDGPCGSRPPKTKCEQERDDANPLLLGAFTPECEKDGSYKKAQCHGSTGYCWCVDELGIKLEETEIQFKEPNCEVFDICDISLCDFGKCVNVNGSATCVCNEACPFIEQPVCGSDNKTYSNLCVMDAESCTKKQHINLQHDGPCGSRPPKTKCEQERDDANPLLLGAFIPECEKDGSYKKAQCHGSTGYCWCVDELGFKLEETEIRFKEPNCEEVFDICDISLCDFGKCVNVNGSATCECNEACPFIEQPVCGSDNKTYSNLCVMDAESCTKKQHINLEHDGPCAKPQVGELRSPCANVRCGFYSECEFVDGRAKCVCHKGCTKELNLTCGSDGIIYSNPCELRRASCEQMKEITVANDGECAENITSCKQCPTSGKEKIVKSFCNYYNRFVINGKVVDIQASKGVLQEITVNITKRYKPRKIGTTNLKKSTLIKIAIKGIKKDCRCENLDIKINESYILMGKISKKNKKLYIKPKKRGFVEVGNPDNVKTLKKGFRRQAKYRYFCRKVHRG